MTVKTINGLAFASVKTVLGTAIASVKAWLGVTTEPPFIDMNATQFTLGNTGNVDWTGSSADPNSTDVNIRTALSLVSLNQDFDVRVTVRTGSAQNGPGFGFYSSGTTNGTIIPGTTDPVVWTRNGGGAVGWLHGNEDVDGSAKSAGWMENHVVQISRRGTTFYGLIDGVLDKTFAEVTGGNAGGFFIGCSGGSHAWQMDNVQYRLGPGLPSI